MTMTANPLPHLVRDLSPVVESSVVEYARPAVADAATAAAANAAVVCRTVVVHADREQLQAELERELRALLGFGGRLGR